jgi:hypothetical protein
MAIQSTALDTTVGNIYVSSGTDGNVVSVAYFCNRSASNTAFSLYLVSSGQTAGANNVVYSNKQITAGDTYILELEKIILSNGDMLQASANTANVIVATVSTLGI